MKLTKHELTALALVLFFAALFYGVLAMAKAEQEEEAPACIWQDENAEFYSQYRE